MALRTLNTVPLSKQDTSTSRPALPLPASQFSCRPVHCAFDRDTGQLSLYDIGVVTERFVPSNLSAYFVSLICQYSTLTT